MRSKLFSTRDLSGRRQPPDEIFSVKSVVSKRTQQESRFGSQDQGETEDARERYKQALKDRVSDNASCKQEKSSRSRSRSNNDKSFRERNNISTFSAISNHFSNRAKEVSNQRSSPLRANLAQEDLKPSKPTSS